MAQGNAIQMTKMVNEITVTEADGGAILPEGTKGMIVKVINASLADTRIFPTVTGHIDQLGADNFFILPFGNSEVFNCFKINRWRSQSNGIYYIEKRIPSSQVLTLSSSRVEFIPAPGVGRVIKIVGLPIVEVVFNSTAYTDDDLDGRVSVELLYDTATKPIFEHTNILQATAESHAVCSEIAIDSTADSQIFENKAIVIDSTEDNPDGDSPIIIRAFYRIVDASSIQNHFSFLFDGVNESFNIASDNLNFGDSSTDSPFSITVWVNLADATNSTIISKVGIVSPEWSFRLDGSDKLDITLYDNSLLVSIGRVSDSALTSDEGSYIHVGITYDGSGSNAGLKLYKNGVLISSTGTSAGSYVAMHDTVSVPNIGHHLGINYFNGNMDEMKFMNKELSVAEMLEDYNNGTVPRRANLSFVTNLLAAWPMGDGNTFGGGVWTMNDEIGSNDALSVNMEEGDRVDDIPV